MSQGAQPGSARMIDVLEDALGDTATEVSVWRATRGRNAQQLGVRLLDSYERLDLVAVPPLAEGERRPAYLSTVGFPEGDPEQDFIWRTLIYADSCAVPDDLALWREVARDGRSSDLGFMQGTRTRDLARKILRNAELERAGLVHYVQPLSSLRKVDSEARDDLDVIADGDHGSYTWQQVRAIAPLAAEWAGIAPRFADQERAVMPYLSLWLDELRDLFAYVAMLDGAVDIALPDWMPGPELLDWMLGSTRWGRGVDLADASEAAVLSTLLRLPNLAGAELRGLTSRDLIGMRQEPGFSTYRADLRRVLVSLPLAPNRREAFDAVQEMQARRDELERRVSRRSDTLRPLTDATATGVLIGAAAGMLSQQVLPAVALGVIPYLIPLAGAVRAGRHRERTSPYTVFLNAASVDGRGRPRSRVDPSMRDAITGRPIVSPMSRWFRE
ncbi:MULTISPECIES: hypothetical protein [unclassified Microbacterium]|uniref:hypothetical protein n=1 Tax=unclassified Microbacterium TaxID=2609290 RepID=UPI0030105AEE